MTHDDPVLGGMYASFPGVVLGADASGCVYAENGADRMVLVWPKDYAVEGDPESFTVLDSDGSVAARSGVEVDLGGGMLATSKVNLSELGLGELGCATGDLWFVNTRGEPPVSPAIG